MNDDHRSAVASQSEPRLNKVALDPKFLTEGTEGLSVVGTAEEFARRVALKTPLRMEAALVIVQAALAASENNVQKAAQQVSSQLASITGLANRSEAIQQLATTTSELAKATLKSVERSSRWTLLFIGVGLGFLTIAAPYALLITNGRSAESTAEYLVTSLTGGVIVLTGFIGIIASDRGARNATENISEKNTNALEQLRNML